MSEQYLAPLAGGALIGAAAVAFMALNGRIAGISGIVAGVMTPRGVREPWRVAFVLGLLAAPVAFLTVRGEWPALDFPHPLAVTLAGGVLVGFGSRYGSGCTSGHGVCGMARLSRRSVAATFTFMATAMIVVFILHGIIGL